MSPDVELSGYAEARANMEIGASGFPLKVIERVRPSLKAHPTERISAEVVVEGSLTQGRDDSYEAQQLIADSEVQQVLDQGGCVYSPPPKYAAASDYLSVERLHLDFNLPALDLSIGRQAVAWGSSLIFHPTDPFPEVVATEPWKERRGVNAVKAEVPIGDHSVTALVAVDDDLSEFYRTEPDPENLPMTAALRGTVRALETDWSLVGWGRPDGVWFAGADLRGNLEVGWWVEGGWHGGAEETHDGAAPVEVVVGVDYSLPILNRFYMAAEYRYDGTGEDQDNYVWASRSVAVDIPYVDCAFSLKSAEDVPTRTSLGRHYLHGILQVGFTEDVAVSAVTILNIQDKTGFLSVDSSYLVGSRWTLHAGAQVPYGEEGEYSPPDTVTTVRVGKYTADLSPLLYDANVLAWARYAF